MAQSLRAYAAGTHFPSRGMRDTVPRFLDITPLKNKAHKKQTSTTQPRQRRRGVRATAHPVRLYP